MKNIYYLAGEIPPKPATCIDSETKEEFSTEKVIPLEPKDFMLYEMLNKILEKIKRK